MGSLSDGRWIEVEADFAAAIRHFGFGIEIFARGGLEGESLMPYMARMAFLHAFEVGYTSLESGLERIMELVGEDKPVGASYHADLVRRFRTPLPGVRPALFFGELGAAVNETRRFRHVARKTYDDFDVVKGGTAVEAARLVATQLTDALTTFRRALDPPSDAPVTGPPAGP